jgi:hypothetical protein
MIETADASNLDKYKSYIQRRRVGPDSTKASESTQPLIKQAESLADYDFGSKEDKKDNVDRKSPLDDLSYVDTRSSSFGSTNSFGPDRSSESMGNHYSAPATTARRTDPGLYRRLYGQNRKNSHVSHYTGSHHGYATSGSSSHAEIEDNRTTVLAVKIIKQALACFAVLGIIVLLQQRSDTGQILAFVKKHVVDTHIEPQGLLAGVENIWKECSRFLGGSP